MLIGSNGVSRRHLLQAGVAVVIGAGLGASARAARFPVIPQRPNCRVIVDNDFAGDPDALVGLAHQLLSPKSRVPLITVTPLPPKFRGLIPLGVSAARGKYIVLELLTKIGEPAVRGVNVVVGPESFDPASARGALAAHAIVAEALKDDPLPLFVTCGGPLTNVAASLQIEPAIAKRMTVIWIGGGNYPAGGWEYNLAADIDAAREVVERSKVPLWQVPQSTYRQMQVSVAELRARMRAISPLGQWLYGKFTSPPDFVDIGGAWPMGDSPPVILTAISMESGVQTTRKAQTILPDLSYGEPIPDRDITLVETVDVRLAMEDFYAKLQIAAAS